MTIKKRGFRISIPLEVEAAFTPGAPRRKSHYEPVTPTEEQIAQHARAKLALEELEENPYVSWPRMDDEIRINELATERLVFDETHEEYMARVREWSEARS